MINGVTGPDSISKDLVLLEKCKSILRSKKLPDITSEEISTLTLGNLNLSPDRRFIHAKFKKPEGEKDIIYAVLDIRQQIDLTLVGGEQNSNESK